jgi:hypothetical protein
MLRTKKTLVYDTISNNNRKFLMECSNTGATGAV